MESNTANTAKLGNGCLLAVFIRVNPYKISGLRFAVS